MSFVGWRRIRKGRRRRSERDSCEIGPISVCVCVCVYCTICVCGRFGWDMPRNETRGFAAFFIVPDAHLPLHGSLVLSSLSPGFLPTHFFLPPIPSLHSSERALTGSRVFPTMARRPSNRGGIVMSLKRHLLPPFLFLRTTFLGASLHFMSVRLSWT